jgi:hypothetical protein
MSYNQPGYKWYVVWMKPLPRDSRILSAWEYEEDAYEALGEVMADAKHNRFPAAFEVVAKRTCKQRGLDPDDDLNWRKPPAPKKYPIYQHGGYGVDVRLISKHDPPGVFWSSKHNSFVVVRDPGGGWVSPWGGRVSLYSINGIGEIRWPVWESARDEESRAAVEFFDLDELATENPRKNGTPAEHAVGVRTYEDNLRLYAKRFDEAPTRVELIDSALDFASSHGRMWDAINGAYQPHGEKLSPVEKARMDKWDAKLDAIRTRLKAVCR